MSRLPSAEPRTEVPRQEPSPFNIPNLICATRLVGSLGLVYLSATNKPVAFICLYFVLHFSDWIDGKLARLWNQRTTFGARLDSVADASIYATLLLGAWWLKEELIREEAVWLIVAIAAYVLSLLASLLRFGKLPSYHTWSAKFCWGLTGLAAFGIFIFDVGWPLRVAMTALTLANLEAIAISFVIPEWRTDVKSLFHVLKERPPSSGVDHP